MALLSEGGLMDVARFILATFIWLAGNMLFVTSIVWMRKGYPDKAFGYALEGLAAMIAAAVILP